MKTLGILVAWSLLLAAAPVHGQWYVGLEVGTARYGGSARDTSTSGIGMTFRPGTGTSIGLRMTRRFAGGRTGAMLRVAYAKPGLSGAAPGVVVTDRTTGELLEAATLMSFQVWRVGPSGAVRAELGPSLHLWKGDQDWRRRAGAIVAAAYEWPVVSRLSGAIRLEGMISKSWFDPGDLPAELERRVTWRYGVGLGLRYRLSAK